MASHMGDQLPQRVISCPSTSNPYFYAPQITLNMQKILAFSLLLLFSFTIDAQPDRWQQGVKYEMNIDMDVNTHQYSGKQEITYYNNSPDHLEKAYFHLYFNAFQPGSMMDVRSRTIEDPDGRIGDRISKLTPDQQGWMKVSKLSLNGKPCSFEVVGTVMEVNLPSPIKAGGKVTFEMEWTAQVPLQIRRSGRQNAEGIEYSMTQWFPKLAEYDYEGWHANPYVGREFYGPWGDFEVNITIDKNYVVAASGVLQNPGEIGKGYPAKKPLKEIESDKITYEFLAENVHDFMWAADPDYVHDMVETGDMTFHFFYQDDEEYGQTWRDYQETFVDAFSYIEENFGDYPYPVYVVAQGGDGGMEYPMSTLVTGRRSYNSLLGVSIHEAFHSWYQGLLASNEALYEWMDEGFTSFGTSETMNHVLGGEKPDTHERAYESYIRLAQSEEENPMSTHADHYTTNYAYGVAAYSKGEVLVNQLGYVIGRDVLMEGMIKYFNTWKFKHPNPTDFKRVMEKHSSIELDWYFEYFVNSTHTIDYGIRSLRSDGQETSIQLERVGLMPMPLDILVKYTDGREEWYNIPLQIMRGEKVAEGDNWTVLEDWPWTHPVYEFSISTPADQIESISIDPKKRMADVDRSNNELNPDGSEYIIFKNE